MLGKRFNEFIKNEASLWDKLITFPQYCIPQHFLSMAMYRITRCEKTWFKNLFIRFIVKIYKVDVDEAAETDLNTYPSFNAFFTRELKPDARPVDEQAEIVSPVDGVLSQLGELATGQLVHAKGHDYSVLELLGGDTELAEQFQSGQFATIYLSPRDYHRIHMPLTGKLTKMRYVPGQLFSVSLRTVEAVPKLFANNERVIVSFDTEFGPMVMVLIGAIFVGSMETVWSGQVTPPYGKAIQQWTYLDDQAISLQKGEEMGRFNMGSTVVMLFGDQAQDIKEQMTEGAFVRMGEALTQLD